MRYVPTRLLVAALLGLGGSALHAQQKIDKRLALNPDASVRVYVLSGTVRVIGWDRDSIVVTGQVANAKQFHIGGSPRGMKMGQWDEESGTDAPSPVQLEIRLPSRSRVWVKMGFSGNVDVSGMSGGLDLNIVGGKIHVAGAPKEVSAEAMDGDIEITGSPAWLRAKTASGVITVRGSVEDVGLTTVSGSITFVGDRVQRGRFETVSGNLRFDGRPARASALDFDNHSGSTELTLPSDIGADFQVTTLSGTIQNWLTSVTPTSDRRLTGGRELAFTTKDGGTRISVRSFKGSVVLRAQ